MAKYPKYALDTRSPHASVHDHVIITRSGHTSFKTKGLL